VLDWEAHCKASLAAAEPGKQYRVPVHILQHTSGQQQPVSHFATALAARVDIELR